MVMYTDWTHWVGFKQFQPIQVTTTWFIGINGTSTHYHVANGDYYLQQYYPHPQE